MTQEFKTEQRITELMRPLRLPAEDVRRVYDLFDKLLILKKHFPASNIARNRVTFAIAPEEYRAIMEQINRFCQEKGISDVIFRDPADFDLSSEDYDYYYGWKTPTEYLQDEVNRTNA